MRPDDIVEEFVEEPYEYKGRQYPEHRWTITWRPIKQWTFDQFGSADGSWNSEGTITLWESDDYNYRLIIKTWRGEFMLYTYVDQWGTYYYGEGDFYIASEAGTRSFWIAYLEALQLFSASAEFTMKPPTVEEYGQTWREANNKLQNMETVDEGD